MKYLMLSGATILAIVWRLFNAEAFLIPGLELFTALAIVGAMLFRSSLAILIPVTAIGFSDILLGNDTIFVWTWAAWIAVAGIAMLAKRSRDRIGALGFGALIGLLSSTLFFLVTNAGVWWIGVPQGWYPPGLEGLLMSYTMGLPFYETAIVGNLVFAPLAAVLSQVIREREVEPTLVPVPAA